MTHHDWCSEGEGIDSCCKCGMFRATAKREPRDRRGDPKGMVLTVEYSQPDGEVIALNPRKVPECAGGGVYVDQA